MHVDEVLEKIFWIRRDYRAFIFQGLDAVVKQSVSVFVQQEISVCENGKSVDTIEVVQPTVRLRLWHDMVARDRRI
jgi:hypothetical protein